MNGHVDSSKPWGSRRSHKIQKMELLDLQRSLQSEIRAKQQINDELSNTRTAYMTTKQRLDESQQKVNIVTDRLLWDWID